MTDPSIDFEALKSRLKSTVPDTVEFFRISYGPTQRAFSALPEDKQQALRHDLESHFAQHNQAADGTTQFESEYLEVAAIRA